jgi:hypothetical protein
MKRRFFDSQNNRFLHLTIHSPGLYLYRGKPINAKLLKALRIYEAPLVGAPLPTKPLMAKAAEAGLVSTLELEQTSEFAEALSQE